MRPRRLPVDDRGRPPERSPCCDRASARSEATKYGRTLAGRLRHDRQRGNGFDTIRLIAAALVLVSHSFPIATGSNANEPLYVLTRGQATFGDLSVGVFFFISGLLISNSFDTSKSAGNFVRKRALRIMPALVVLCVVMIFFLGPVLTESPLESYFAGSWRFMKNAVFLPSNFELPGVFRDHPMIAVDGSLWSLKFEVACYAGAALLLMVHRSRVSIAFLLWIASFLIARWTNGGVGTNGAAFYIVTIASLYRFFGAGVVCYVLADRLVLRRDIACIAFAVSVLAVLTPFFVEVASIFGSYALLVFAYECPKWFSKITAAGDISYGTYLYAFPIQQMMIPITGANPWFMTLAAMPLTLFAASGSWLLVEKPALRMKRSFARSSGPQPSTILVGGSEAAIGTDLNIFP